MRKYLLSFVLMLFIATITPQLNAQVDRQAVVVEVATGTWCTYCPGAALGGDDLIKEFGNKVIVIEHHINDPFSTGDGENRANIFYGITGTPTTWFDGDNPRKITGGSATNSLFSQYQGRYNTAIVVPSPLSLQLALIEKGNDNYDAEVVLTQQSVSMPANLRLQVVLTESHLPTANPWPSGSSPMPLTEVNNVNRQMSPTSNGTPVTMPGGLGQTTTLTVPFTLSPGWDRENLKLIAFVEDAGNKNILQAQVIDEWLPNNFVLDATARELEVVDVAGQCGTILPEVKFRNQGRTPITSLMVEYQVNSDPVQTFLWSGNLPINTNETIQLPQVSYTNDPNGNVMTVRLKNPNGQADEDLTNNELTYRFDATPQPAGNYVVQIDPDGNPGEITWEVLDPTGGVVASGGPYTGDRRQFATFFINEMGCHQFKVYDAGGDGITGGGFAMLYSAVSQDTLAFATDFGAQNDVNWEVDAAQSNQPTLDANAVSISPNPFQESLNVNLAHYSGGDVSFDLMTTTGRTITHLEAGYFSGTSSHTLDVSDLASGVYLLRIQTADGVLVEKVVKQ